MSNEQDDWRTAIDLGVRFGVITPEAARRALDGLDQGSAPREAERLADLAGIAGPAFHDLVQIVRHDEGSTPDMARYEALVQAMLRAPVPLISPPPPESPPMPAEWGTEVPRRLGSYDLLEPLGHGGRGVVFRARHGELGTPAAVKVLIAGEHASPEELERFRLEASAVQKMGRHPNIVEVYHFAGEGNLAYYAMEFVEGKSLTRLLREHEYAPQDAAALVEKVARAVHFAHTNGILHLDLKPDNVLVRADGEPQVIDFGIAREVGRPGGGGVERGRMGTWNYMAPEQARGETDRWDARTDVYGLGGILYQVLTGFPPHPGDAWPQISRHVMAGRIVAPGIARPGSSPGLGRICLRCLEPEPDMRYSTAESLAEDLARFQRAEPVPSR